MGSSTQTTEVSSTIPGIGEQESRARALMMQLAESGQGQLGDLGALARGDMQITPQDEALIRQIAQLTGDLGRAQAQQNYEALAPQVEGQLLERGLEGSSIEAVNQAMLGRQLQQTLDQSSLQQQLISAQQLQQQPLARAGIQLNANQLLLQRILGGAQSVGQMGLQERWAQTTETQTTETPFNWGGVVGAVAGDIAGSAFMPTPAGPMPMPQGTGNAAYQPGAANNPYYGPGY